MRLPTEDKKFLFLIISVILVLILEVLSLLDLHIPMPYAPFIFLIFIVGIGHSVLLNGIKAIFKLKFSSINLLMTIAVIAAFFLKEYPEAAVVIVLYVLGERLEDIGLENSKSAMDRLINEVPKTAFVKSENKAVPISNIAIGTLIQIKPGEMIPLDGKIVSGETFVDEAPITGEPLPKEKQKGDFLFAGTLNQHGFIEMQTTKLFTDTTFAKIIRLTFEAVAAKSNTQKFIDRFSKIYTPTVIILAILIFGVPVLILNLDFDLWLKQAITLLVIACPCALVISTPVAIYAAIGNASAKGALIKGGKYLEAMAEIRLVALDKTRTLTYGSPTVSDLYPLNGANQDQLLSYAAGVEQYSEHPLAKGIVTACIDREYQPALTNNFRISIGNGASANCPACGEKTLFVGNAAYIAEQVEVTEEAKKIINHLSYEGKTVVAVAVESRLIGIIGLTDEIKEGTAEALQKLKKENVELAILTGDNQKAARQLANRLGIKLVFAELLPEDKSAQIKAMLQQYGKVAMVGDGINDAPALAQSTVGIAMGAAGSDTAIETANIALMNDKLSLLSFLIRLSKKTLFQIKVNTLGAVAIKLFFIALAFFGFSNLVLAIAADVGVTLVVILLSLNLMNFEKEPLKAMTIINTRNG